MKIGIIGQKWLAAQVFSELIAANEMVFVAAPDEQDRLYLAAKNAGVPVIAYRENGLRELECFKVDLLICAHAFTFIPTHIREIAAYSIGYHPSLLPLFKGRRSIENTILAGQRVTGGTVYHLTDEMDAGPVAFQDWCFIHEGEDAADLWRRALAPIGLELLMKAADHLVSFGFIPGERQESVETCGDLSRPPTS